MSFSCEGCGRDDLVVTKLFLLFNFFIWNFFIWVHFHPFYFLFAGEGAFDAGYVYDDLGENTSKDLDEWDKLGTFFGLGVIWRMVVQLLG